MSSISEQAEKLITGIKRDEYGPIELSFEAIARIWTGTLGVRISSRQVALCMIGLKLYRESYKHKKDNLIDIIGYVKCLEKMEDNRT